MTSPLLMGVDLGSQSVKAALFDLTGACRAEAVREIPVHRRAADEVDQEPGDFFDAAMTTMASCLSRSGCRPADVAAIGVAGQMAGILGVDAGGLAVTPFDSWLDSRCRPELDEIDRELGDRVTELTGCPPMVAHAPKMLWWKRKHPDIYARVAKFVVPSAFVAGRLADIPADELFIDWTHLHFSGLADAVNSCWSPELTARVGISPARLPRVVAPTDLVGTLSESAARGCGLLSGTPLAAGLGDTAAGALGAGVVRPGQLLDTAGTACVLAISTEDFRPDTTRALVSMRGAVAGQWFSLSYLAGGDLLNWLPRVLGATSLGVLMEEAAAAPGGRLLFLPHLGGRILPAEPRARGAWVGLDLSQSRGDLARSVLESIAFEYAGYLDRALELFPGVVPSDVRVIGGGSDNVVWNQVKASALGLPYVSLRNENFSCWGAALVAGAAVGAVGDMSALALAATTANERTRPDTRLQAIYCQRRRDYRAALELLAPRPEEARA